MSSSREGTNEWDEGATETNLEEGSSSKAEIEQSPSSSASQAKMSREEMASHISLLILNQLLPQLPQVGLAEVVTETPQSGMEPSEETPLMAKEDKPHGWWNRVTGAASSYWTSTKEDFNKQPVLFVLAPAFAFPNAANAAAFVFGKPVEAVINGATWANAGPLTDTGAALAALIALDVNAKMAKTFIPQAVKNLLLIREKAKKNPVIYPIAMGFGVGGGAAAGFVAYNSLESAHPILGAFSAIGTFSLYFAARSTSTNTKGVEIKEKYLERLFPKDREINGTLDRILKLLATLSPACQEKFNGLLKNADQALDKDHLEKHFSLLHTHDIKTVDINALVANTLILQGTGQHQRVFLCEAPGKLYEINSDEPFSAKIKLSGGEFKALSELPINTLISADNVSHDPKLTASVKKAVKGLGLFTEKDMNTHLLLLLLAAVSQELQSEQSPFNAEKGKIRETFEWILTEVVSRVFSAVPTSVAAVVYGQKALSGFQTGEKGVRYLLNSLFGLGVSATPYLANAAHFVPRAIIDTIGFVSTIALYYDAAMSSPKVVADIIKYCKQERANIPGIVWLAAKNLVAASGGWTLLKSVTDDPNNIYGLPSSEQNPALFYTLAVTIVAAIMMVNFKHTFRRDYPLTKLETVQDYFDKNVITAETATKSEPLLRNIGIFKQAKTPIVTRRNEEELAVSPSPRRSGAT